MLDVWAAGFFDGEGCVQLQINNHAQKTMNVAVLVSVNQVVRRPLEILAARYGGTIHLQQKAVGNKRDCWCWRATGKNAVAFLREVRPYLVVKDTQADLAIEFHEKNPVLRGGVRVPQEVIDMRADYANRLKQLKRS